MTLVLMGVLGLLLGPMSGRGPVWGTGLVGATGPNQGLRPGELPYSFMEPTTLSKLQSAICKG